MECYYQMFISLSFLSHFFPWLQSFRVTYDLSAVHTTPMFLLKDHVQSCGLNLKFRSIHRDFGKDSRLREDFMTSWNHELESSNEPRKIVFPNGWMISQKVSITIDPSFLNKCREEYFKLIPRIMNPMEKQLIHKFFKACVEIERVVICAGNNNFLTVDVQTEYFWKSLLWSFSKRAPDAVNTCKIRNQSKETFVKLSDMMLNCHLKCLPISSAITLVKSLSEFIKFLQFFCPPRVCSQCIMVFQYPTHFEDLQSSQVAKCDKCCFRTFWKIVFTNLLN